MRPHARTQTNGRNRWRFASLAATPILALSGIIAAPTAAHAEPSPTACREVRIPVRAHAQVAGTLCTPRAATTIEVLVPGGTYNRWYWTGTGYTSAANQAGFATLAVDRPGTGKSTQVPAGTNTAGRQADAIHNVLSWVHDQSQWKHVVLGGHSLGSVVVINESSRYHDADAVLVTGYTHVPNIPSVVRLFAGLVHQANKMPGFEDRPALQLTQASQADRVAAFSGPDDPAEMKAADYAHRDTTTPVEMVTGGAQILLNFSKLIKTPVLNVVGDHDVNFYCGLVPCTKPARLTATEGHLYGGPYKAMIAADAGHSLNLAPSHERTYDEMNQWVATALP